MCERVCAILTVLASQAFDDMMSGGITGLSYTCIDLEHVADPFGSQLHSHHRRTLMYLSCAIAIRAGICSNLNLLRKYSKIYLFKYANPSFFLTLL